MRFGLLCLLFLSFVNNALSQTKISGQIVDTVSNTVLRSATVSIYPQGIKIVEKVTLTDRFGKFTVERLSHDKIYRAEFSYQGYQKLTKEFSLINDQELDFGKLHLERRTYELEEVVILPPVRMNGDTIEFNADAFQLDTNAVIEDLIHKLPGMIIWGDGKITYNGKDVPSVLINSKEFFGSDKSIGLQNIAKDAVKKIQVYDTRDKQSQRQNPMDPYYEMNVVLKDEKEKMIFGNITVGMGTDKKHENYLNMNYANRKAQSSIGYTSNNTNKKLNSLDQLLKNTTYKGVGVHADYQSDFNRTGINQQHVLAARYQHDFLGTNETNRKSIITGNVFSNWDKENSTNMANTTVANNSSDYINKRFRQSVSLADGKYMDGTVKYELVKEIKGRNTRINTTLNLSTSELDKQNSSDTDYDYSNNQSRNIRQDHQNLDNKSVAIDFQMSWGTKNLSQIYQRGKKPNIIDKLRYELNWSASLNDNNSLNNSSIHIENHLYPDANQDINRIYDDGRQTHVQHLIFTVLGRNIKISNPIRFSYSGIDRNVWDLNGDSKQINLYLTHASTFRHLTYTPKIDYTYFIFDRSYTGRFSEHFSLKPEISFRILNRSNVSTLAYRNIEQNFVSYLPKFGLEYGYNKYGVYLFTSGLGYQYGEDFPSIDQLQPIYDDNNPSYRYFGNPNLSRTDRHTLSGILRFQENKAQSLMVNFNTSYNIIGSAIRDSIFFAPNQQQVFAVNMAKRIYDFNMSIDISKPFTVQKNQTFTFEINASSFSSKNYQFINSELQELAPINQTINFVTYYTNTNIYQFSWKGGYYRYDSRNLTSLTNSFSSTEYNTAFSLSFAVNKKLKIGSDVNGRFIASNNIHNNLTIWNANIAHRFTKGNNLEAKIAVYDILNQNKGIYVNNGMNEITTGYLNNLRQFFQVSISYFPRKFGL